MTLTEKLRWGYCENHVCNRESSKVCAAQSTVTCLRNKTDKPPARSDEHIRHWPKPKDTLHATSAYSSHEIHSQTFNYVTGALKWFAPVPKSGELTNNSGRGHLKVKSNTDGWLRLLMIAINNLFHSLSNYMQLSKKERNKDNISSPPTHTHTLT